LDANTEKGVGYECRDNVLLNGSGVSELGVANADGGVEYFESDERKGDTVKDFNWVDFTILA
jgi:hypothetical protein